MISVSRKFYLLNLILILALWHVASLEKQQPTGWKPIKEKRAGQRMFVARFSFCTAATPLV